MVESYANRPSGDRPDYLFGDYQFDRSKPSYSNPWPMANPGRRVADGGLLRDPKQVSCWSAQLAGLSREWRSGPADYFYYLLAAGSRSPLLGAVPTCDGRPVTGIGNAKAEKIWYRALTAHMNVNTDYRAARIATLRAAAELYGDHGVEYNTVNSAWAAVSVRGADPFPGGSAPRLTNPGDQSTRMGSPVNLQIEASDPRGLPLKYTIEMLDSNMEEVGPPAGLSIDASTGLITGALAAKGTYQVALTVTNSIAEATNTWFQWTVT
ncbi:M4 family metallopeptidase [Phytohabitans kaempferiae]|uniref:M4 family metallopeptidase n=1 Tax=Phytohabitans kaempferiae TaxID=1620943 RepID=A0ABV6M987_9ACTN